MLWFLGMTTNKKWRHVENRAQKLLEHKHILTPGQGSVYTSLVILLMDLCNVNQIGSKVNKFSYLLMDRRELLLLISSEFKQ